MDGIINAEREISGRSSFIDRRHEYGADHHSPVFPHTTSALHPIRGVISTLVAQQGARDAGAAPGATTFTGGSNSISSLGKRKAAAPAVGSPARTTVSRCRHKQCWMSVYIDMKTYRISTHATKQSRLYS